MSEHAPDRLRDRLYFRLGSIHHPEGAADSPTRRKLRVAYLLVSGLVFTAMGFVYLFNDGLVWAAPRRIRRCGWLGVAGPARQPSPSRQPRRQALLMRERMQAWPLAIRLVIVVIGSLVLFIGLGALLHVIDGSKHSWIHAVYWGLALFAFFWLRQGFELVATSLGSSVARACFYLAAIAVAVGIGVFFLTRSDVSVGVIALVFAAYCLLTGVVQLSRFARPGRDRPISP